MCSAYISADLLISLVCRRFCKFRLVLKVPVHCTHSPAYTNLKLSNFRLIKYLKNLKKRENNAFERRRMSSWEGGVGLGREEVSRKEKVVEEYCWVVI